MDSYVLKGSRNQKKIKKNIYFNYFINKKRFDVFFLWLKKTDSSFM